ncbi:MAG: glycosyltransferase, partial [Verrucomicrobiia bacterium]
MRIAFIQDHLRNGGTENQTLHIAHGLASEGIETHVIVFRQGGILDDKADASAFHLHFLNQGPLKTDWFAPRLETLLRSLGIDIVIAMGRMGNCHAGLLCRSKRPYRIVATFRTGKTIPWLQRRALLKADHIIANSQEALSRIAKLYDIERPESTVIYNGCIRNIEPPTVSIQPAPIRLVSASMFRPEKKQQRLLRICKRLPEQINWRLTLAGDGSERSACITEAERLGLADRVDFPGLLSDPNALYQ